MEKGISNLSERLTSSLRRSISHNALKAVNDNAINIADVDASGIGCRADAQKANTKRKPRHTARGRLETGGGGDNKNEDSARLAPRAGRERRPKKLDDLVSSFRQSLQKPFTGNNVPAAAVAVEERKRKKLARVEEKEAGSPKNRKKGFTRAMSSMKMSMRKNLIGELSDYSDSSSSSSEDDISSSDDSSSSSDDSSTGMPTSKKQMQKAVPSMLVYKTDDDVAAAPQKHRRHTTVQIRQIHDNSHVSHHKQEQQQQHAKHRPQQHQVHRPYEAELEACDVPRSDATDRRLVQANADGSSDRRPGSNRHLDQGNTAELHESELTQTNDYLPHGRLDATPEEAIHQHHSKGRRSSEPPSERSSRSKSRSSRSNSSALPKDNSQRSMGSKSRSSRSIYSAEWQESTSNSDHNGSRPSIHKRGSSRSSRRSERGGGTRQENTSESEGGGGGGSHSNLGGGATAAKQWKSKSKRHNNATKSRDSSHQNHRKKEHQSHRHNKLAQLKSSLTSSFSSVTKGKLLSDTAALALEDSRIGGVDQAKVSQHGSSRPRSTRGPSKGRRVASERGDGDRGGATKSSHARRSPTRSGGGSDMRRKKSSSTKDKRPSSSNKKHHSKHKGDSGRGAQHQHQGADEGGAKKKSKRKATATNWV